MNQPWYFIPFIAVYKAVFFILLLPFYLGKTIFKTLKHIITGSSFALVKVIRKFQTGCKACLYFIFGPIYRAILSFILMRNKRKDEKKEKKLQKHLALQKKREEKELRKQQERADKKAKKGKDVYEN